MTVTARQEPGTVEAPAPLGVIFDRPEAEHTACPFWFWNGDMEPHEIVRQIHLMRDKGIGAFVIHARKGLTIPYLSETWFDRCHVALDEAAALGMKVWIYDEENWASGYAGGRVLARDPDYVGQNLIVERHYVHGPAPLRLELERSFEVRAVVATRIAAVHPVSPDPLTFHLHGVASAQWTDRSRYTHVYADEEPLTLHLQNALVSWDAPEGDWCVMVARQQSTDWIAAYSDCRYVDLINAGAVDTFIAETHEQYHARFAAHFGTTILGFFVDEPGFYNNFWDRNVGSLPWTHDLAGEFARRRGYALLPWFPALWEDLGERGAHVRYDYWRTVTEVLRERFFERLAAWCAAHGVLLTGHLEWEEWLYTMTRHSGNPFAALAPLQVPGVDKIDEVTDKLAEKLVASVAHANGRPRVLSETFALTGWKLAPSYMKRIIDYQYVRGVNWLCPHGFYYSIDDYRRRECPPSEFFQNPWWEHSKPLWDYVARLSAVLSQGRHVAPVALYYPIEQAWVTMTPEAPRPCDGKAWEPWQLSEPDLPVQRTDLSLIALGLHLLQNQYDFDLVDHTVLSTASVESGSLRVDQETFRALVVPLMDVMHAQALHRALALAEAGGVVLFVGGLPRQVVGGDAPDQWAALRDRLLQLDRPDFVPYGTGRIGLVQQGIAATAFLLRTVAPADLEVAIDPADDDIMTTYENRGGNRRETVIRPLSSVLTYHRRQVGETDVYFIVNESERRFTATLRLVGGAIVEEWLPLTGEQRALPAVRTTNGTMAVTLPFAAGQSYLLAARSGSGRPESADRWAVNPGTSMLLGNRVTREQRLDDWNVSVAGREWTGGLVNWAEWGLAWHSGQGTYRATFTLSGPPKPGERVVVDLGYVFETAVARINGHALPPLVFAPYLVDITDYRRVGANELVVVVANTNANAFERRERPSGLLGPVRIVTMEPDDARDPRRKSTMQGDVT